ncbi:hypothetical protein LIER_35746 [Lithospermum erythrorhizon]|uniref:Uncharacterized protein n=1 Tax=Lithospermum erythrorhizon TaxID=34254 RepID=A0AAV3NVL1_LITER
MMTEKVEEPSSEGLGTNVHPSVKDTGNGCKNSTFLEEDVLEPSIADTISEGMDTDKASVDDMKPVTAAATGKVTLSVTDTSTEIVGQE